jgi:hypothetical protein
VTETQAPLPLPEPWMYMKAPLDGWWVTQGEWQPGLPERIVAKVLNEEVAQIICADHNARH